MAPKGIVFLGMSPPHAQKDMFLRASREIETVKRDGRRISTSLFNLLVCRMGELSSRAGIVVGKRFGNAVRRNRAKRVFRELVRRSHADLLPGHALLVFPKREALARPSELLKHVWETSLQRAHLLRAKAG